jgi:4-hydroxybenzoate polyprenyltransferase
MRVYQWLKNLLIFLPLLLAHEINNSDKWLNALIAFFSFSLSASFVYIINDLLDLESDRHHPRKCNRPIASGNLSPFSALIFAKIFFIGSFLLAILFLPFNFIISLIIYFVLTSLYSFYLKRIYLLDIITLASLYTTRLIAGAYAVEVSLSYWLLAFSMFIFLSIAIVKRYTELIVMLEENKTYAKGRGYSIVDMSLLRNIGTTTGILSVLIFILYVNSQEIIVLYNNPVFLWPVAICILLWILRIWFIAQRGLMHDDPIVFISKDKVSYLIALIILILVIAASI